MQAKRHMATWESVRRATRAILISKSGATPELLQLAPMLRELKSPLIGILGNLNSPLAGMVDCLLDARVSREADALNLAPTCSTTVALGLGDALAVTLMERRGFNEQDFARFHPSGQLGRNLTERVADVMHPQADDRGRGTGRIDPRGGDCDDAVSAGGSLRAGKRRSIGRNHY